MKGARGQDELTEAEKQDLVCLARFSSVRLAHQAGTAILSMGEWYVVLRCEREWGLYVRSDAAAEAGRLVWLYQQEGQGPAAIPVSLSTGEPRKVAPWHLVPYPVVIMLVFWISMTDAGSGWVEAGRFDSLRIRAEGEWWRLVTPLFLHADAHHVLGNVFGGLFFGGLLALRIGPAAVYGVALFSGIAGNFINLVTFRDASHLSIGASTAVFGLLGGLVGLRLSEMAGAGGSAPAVRHARWMRAGVFGIGLVLLGWLGSGGARTDVPAHLYGFTSGGLLLFAAGSLKRRLRRPGVLPDGA